MNRSTVPVIATGIFLLLSPYAWALDCTSATSKIDRAICDDAGLRAQDADLSRVYFSVLKGTSGSKHSTLIEDQRGWLKERSDLCSKKSVPLIDCLSKTMEERKAQIEVCFSGSMPAKTDKNILCAITIRNTCPASSVRAAANVFAYPFLVAVVQKQVALDSADPADPEDKNSCAPEDADHPGTPDQNQDDYQLTIRGAGPGWVTTEEVDDSFSRGDAHPFHTEQVTAYDAVTGKSFSIAELLSGMRADPAGAQQLRNAANQNLSVPCCGEDGKKQTLDDLSLDDDHELPDAWSVENNGTLRIYYSYTTLGRSYVATSTIMPSVFMKWVDPKYRSIFKQKSN